jgi:hypothetical protein
LKPHSSKFITSKLSEQNREVEMKGESLNLNSGEGLFAEDL